MPKLSKKVKLPLLKVKVVKHHQELSVRTLIIFILAFGIIGYFIYQSFAAGPLVASLQGEQMAFPSGASVVTDSSASGGQALKLSSTGTATGSVNFPSSINSMAVIAKGGQCQGSPTMIVKLDSTALLSNTSVSSTGWTTYSVTPAASIASGTHSLSITFNNAYTFAGHGKKGNGACSRNLYIDVTNFYGPTQVTPPPTVALSASPTSVAAGQSSTLTWSSTNASSCTASGTWGGNEPVSGSLSTGALNQTSSYSLSCAGAGGTATASATVTVSNSPPTISISASPTTVTSGQSATLTWSSANAASCTATGAWSGTKATSGSTSTAALAQTSTYSLTCTGSEGTATASATVTVSSGTGLNLGSLLFGDEFNGAAGSEPSSTLWAGKTYTSGASGCPFVGWNLVHEDGNGNILLGAQKTSSGSWQCSSISGKVGYSGQRYVEARAKVACGYGTWNAPIWEWAYPYGAGGLENDVNEQLGKETSAYHTTLHNWTVSPQKQSGSSVSASSTLCNGFHTYGSAVYSDHIDFYLDGVKIKTILASAIGLTNLTSYEEVMNISLNMGGSWAGTPTISGPASELVDYIHVYRLN